MQQQMLTVPEAARRVGRDPETVRRWIRSGKLRSQKVGTQHLIDEDDLDQFGRDGSPPHPKAWRRARTWTGEPPIDWAQAIRRSREGR
jgi:excisionase family DNA binding protein